MKNIKKLKTYGKAVAGSALLVGATLTGAAGLAAAQDDGSSGDLGDFPSPFVDDEGNVDTTIVVGTDGKQADVVSAVDIAGHVGNNAFAEEAVEGGSSAAVDGESLDEETLGDTVSTTSIDASDYSAFTRETVEDDDGDDVFVTESAEINGVDSRINGTSTQLDMGQGDVSYAVKYSPGFAENDTLHMLGEEYELVNIESSSEIELGSSMEEDVEVGDSYDHDDYTVEVTGRTSEDDSRPVVRVSEGEEVLERQALGEGDTLEVDDGDFTVTADTVIFYEDGSEDIVLESTHADTTLEEGETLPSDENYEVDSIDQGSNADGDTTVTSITVDNLQETTNDPDEDDNEETDYVEAGEAFEGPVGMFSVTNDGVTSESMTDIEFGEDGDVDFEDPNAQEMSFSMEDLTDGADVVEDDYVGLRGDDNTDDDNDDHYVVEVSDVNSDEDEVEITHNDFDRTFSVDDADGSFSYDDTADDYDGEAASGSDVAYQTVDTGYGFEVTVEWEDTDGSGDDGDVIDGGIDNVNVYSSYEGQDSTGTTTGVATATTQNGAELTMADADSTADGDISGDIDGSTGSDVVTLDETAGVEDNGNSDYIHVVYDTEEDYDDADDGEIGEVHVAASGGSADALTDVDDGDETLSTFGSEVELGSATGADVSYPDEERYQAVAFGSTDADSAGDSDAVSQTPTGFPAGTAALDEDVSNSERDQNMILVGGPEVNTLTDDLADDDKTWNSSEYEDNQGVGVLDLVDDAFNDGYSALVVAGWQAEDTSAAADYLVNYNSDEDTALEGVSTAQVNTDTGELVE